MELIHLFNDMIMKTKILSICSIAVLAIALMSACSDVVKYQDGVEDLFHNDGAPAIAAVYDAMPDADQSTPINVAVLKQFIRVQGQNLSHPKRVVINGIDVDVRQIYAESNSSWIRIPRVVPEMETGKLEYETEQGKAVVDFNVTIPHLELEGLENEFVLQGNEVRVKGDFFDLYEFNDTTDASTASITITNEAAGYREVIKTDSCTESYTGIIIPEDCPDNSLITFSWVEKGENFSKTIPYRMTDQLMFGDFSGDLGWWNDWGKSLVTTGGNGGPEYLGFGFLRVTGTFAAWDWNSTGFGCNWRWLDAAAHPENYVMKFEVWTNSNNPYYSYGDNGLNGAQNGGYCLTLNGGDPRRQYDPISEFGITNTYGHWMTVSMPLNSMFDENHQLPLEEAWVSLEFVLQPNPVDGESPWTVDHAWGQFRIEPKQY